MLKLHVPDRRSLRVSRTNCVRPAPWPSRAVGQPAGNGGEMDSASMSFALHEAVSLYEEAKRMAQEQTKQELMDSWRSEQTSVPQGTRFTPSSETAITNFWVEQGLTDAKASYLTRELMRRDPSCSIDHIHAKLNRLTRVLPEVDLPELVCRDIEVLDMNINAAVNNLITLVQLFPTHDITAMVVKQPRLLQYDDLETRVPRVLKHLAQVHPSQDLQVASRLIEEHPELLYRMDYYKSATLIDELPIEIQNMMVIADKGIGYLYNYWRNKKAAKP